MKKLSSVLIALFFTAICFGQEEGLEVQKAEKQAQKVSPEMMAKMHTARLTQRLSLTDDQKEVVYKIQFEAAEKYLDNRANYKENPEESRQNRIAIQKDVHSEIEKILTGEQLTTFNEMKKRYGQAGSKNEGPK